MNYELAKKLEKGGFKFIVPVTKANEKYLEYPQLSELVKACGDEQFFVGRFFKGGSFHITRDGSTTLFEAKTIEEAVTKLWLTLNK